MHEGTQSQQDLPPEAVHAEDVASLHPDGVQGAAHALTLQEGRSAELTGAPPKFERPYQQPD
eukprot:1161670-Pelagomonas_calceolata.AAC.7